MISETGPEAPAAGVTGSSRRVAVPAAGRDPGGDSEPKSGLQISGYAAGRVHELGILECHRNCCRQLRLKRKCILALGPLFERSIFDGRCKLRASCL